jgi:hypothetical protein
MSTTGCCRGLSAKDCIARPYGCSDGPVPAATLNAARWRHKKRGSTYIEIGRGKLQSNDPTGLGDMQPMVVYRSEADGSLWVRPEDEFDDGRFEALAVTRPQEKTP